MVGSEISVVRESGMRGIGLIKPVSGEDLRRLCWDVPFEWRKIEYEDELKQLGDAGKTRRLLLKMILRSPEQYP
jgi:hypothetical protein